MAKATTLLELMQIRAANRNFIDSINGTQGTVIGFENFHEENFRDNEPAVIVFVPQKIHPKWLPESELLPREIVGPRGLHCRLDVVEGRTDKNRLRVERDESELATRLRGWDDQIWAGSQISYWTDKAAGKFDVGTVGAIVKDRASEVLGLLTNQHVAGELGTKLYHPVPWGLHVASTSKVELFALDEDWYGPLVDEPDTVVRIDCAFASFSNDVKIDEINPSAMGVGKIGPLLGLDVNDKNMSVVGMNVKRVGRTTGLRRGKIIGFGYEYKDLIGDTRYTDLMISGTEMDEQGELLPFSTSGDSGSLIMTDDDENRPLGMLWGGGRERRRSGRGIEKWSWGVCLSRILDKLNVELIHQF